MKILAVDDDSDILELMPLIAARSGFTDVTTFLSARLALDELIKGESVFECLLLDINMPDMNGIELCGRVRQLEAYRKTPIIMLTAMSEREYMDNAFKAGATDFATKPFDISELGARLRVAQELVVARREALDAKRINALNGSTLSHKHAFELSEAIFVGGSENLIDFFSLKNYINQSSRAGLAASQVIAIKVDRIEDLYVRASTDEFSYALQEVAFAVNEALRTRGCLIAYSGNGMFVAVSNSAAPLASGDIEAEVQHILDERNLEYNSGEPLDVNISIGNPVQPNYGDANDVSKSCYLAIARADSRFLTKHNLPPAVNIRRVGP